MRVQCAARTNVLTSTDDPQLAAFRRLLADAHHGGQAKVDALVALAQRTVFVVPWPGGIEGWRTLVNSDGVAALPIFTSFAELDEAARRYGWLDARGNPPAAEVGARAALNYAIREQLSFVVVDIAAEHALEIARPEFEPLTAQSPRHDSSGPYAGAGKVSSSLMRAVRPTPPPMRASDIQAQIAAARTATPPQPMPAATPPVPIPVPTLSGITLTPLEQEPNDALMEDVADVLRTYPEVEWASFCAASRGASAPLPAIGLRVDASYRQRVSEIDGAVRKVVGAHGAALDVLLLDDAALMRAARAQGVVFYPWRQK